MLSAVLDTNIVVSAHLRSDGRQSQILRLGLAATFRMVVSETLLQEYTDVLCRPRFGLTPELAERSLREIRLAAHVVTPRQHFRAASDPGDDHVVDCAVEGRADYIVTGNTVDFPREVQGVQVVTPLEFQTILATISP